ncbi:amidohydrolase family protein [Bacillus timonensis]|nr:amidohydrolase family protein [Bacillus timonensis]
MKIIDAHMHFSRINSFFQTANTLSFVDYSYEGIMKEYSDNNVVLGIAMGLTEATKDNFPDKDTSTPMGIDLTAEIPKKIVYCAGINPYDINTNSLHRLENEIIKPNVVGMKIYLGYYPFFANDEVYQPIYRLAKKYQLPIVFHTGDTYSERGLLKYSHPLTLDEVAVEHKDVTFIMAHFGDPWVLDGAEVVYKNTNMYADLSGLVVGTSSEIKRHQSGRFFDHLLHALSYCDHYDKLIFGTDWPLIPIRPYIQLIKDIVPCEYHEDVFYNNALKVFPKIKQFIE